MVRLSSPIGRLGSHYDVVVVGSGYGGAIAACRLARAGARVCLLERGRELQPGEYPNTLAEARSEMQVDLPGTRLGSRLGMYDFRSNPGAVSVFMGCGLGGTSLVNANVAISAQDWVFEDPAWPQALRQDLAANGSTYYRLATAMLGSNEYPGTPELHKLQALQDSAARLGATFYRPHINVTFADRTNPAGVWQRACSHCGDCVSGCNVGAKNTTLMNYLPDAWNHGAEIYTQVWVRRLERRGDGWVVRYQHLESGDEPFDEEGGEVGAGIVMLAAGSLGSTEILLRSRAAGLRLSNRLGSSFTGNGDVLGFGYNTEREIDGIGVGQLTVEQSRAEDLAPVGPCITGIIDMRTGQAPERGMVIEEGSIPGAIGGIVPFALAAASAIVGRDLERGPGDVLAEVSRKAESLLLGCYHGATRDTQTYLVMAHDGSDGRLVLDDQGHVRVSWPGVGDRDVFRAIDGRLIAASQALGGVFVKDPVWDRRIGSGLVTVHPLGGCPMGEDAENGVVNHRGQVFSGESGADVFPDLYICDGAVVPRSLGVNPLLTISALAERCCSLIVASPNWRPGGPAVVVLASGAQPSAGAQPAPAGAELTERLAGVLETGDSSLEVRLRAVADDLDGLLAGTAQAAVAGSVVASGSPAPLRVSGGTLSLADGAVTYVLPLRSADGPRILEVSRVVASDAAAARAILHDGAGTELATGELRMRPDALHQQLSTIRILNAPDDGVRLDRTVALGRALGGPLFDVAGGVATAPPGGLGAVAYRKRRTLLAPPPEVHDLRSVDGVPLRLTHHQAGSAGPVLLVHGIGDCSRLFTLDTIGANLLEALAARGYDAWLLDHRGSVLLPGGPADHDLDQVARDVAAAVAAVREATGAGTVQAFGHGMGAAALMMALASGVTGVRSAVVSQFGCHIVQPAGERLLGALPSWARRVEGEVQAGLERHLPGAERCRDHLCEQLTASLPGLFEHRQLNPLTHGALGEVFGRSSPRALDHVAAMTQAGGLVDAAGRDAYLPHVSRLKLPICLLHGAANRRFAAAGTERTLEWLQRANGPDGYTRHVVSGYGHGDCLIGRHAARDVFPLVLANLEETR